MKIKVNGKEQTLASDKDSVEALLKQNDITNMEMVTVQLNGEILEKEQYPGRKLNENDEVEFLYFMGGGERL